MTPDPKDRFWDNFANAYEIVEDFKRFVEFSDECAWAYEE